MKQAKLICPLCGGNLTNQGQDFAANIRLEYQGDSEAKVRYFVCDKCHRDYEVFDPVKHNQRPNEVPASLSVGAVETKYKKGNHVWAKQTKELAGRTGYVMEVDTRCMEYTVRFGTELWIVPEDDLELVDPATEEVLQTVFEREDDADQPLTEQAAYDDYQDCTVKSSDRRRLWHRPLRPTALTPYTMQPTKDSLAMTLMMDDVRQALALHHPSLADTLAAGSLLIRSAYREAAATLTLHYRLKNDEPYRKLADDIVRTVIQQIEAPEDGNDVAEA